MLETIRGTEIGFLSTSINVIYYFLFFLKMLFSTILLLGNRSHLILIHKLPKVGIGNPTCSLAPHKSPEDCRWNQ